MHTKNKEIWKRKGQKEKEKYTYWDPFLFLHCHVSQSIQSINENKTGVEFSLPYHLIRIWMDQCCLSIIVCILSKKSKCFCLVYRSASKWVNPSGCQWAISDHPCSKPTAAQCWFLYKILFSFRLLLGLVITWVFKWCWTETSQMIDINNILKINQ